MQMPLSKVVAMEESGNLMKNSGYRYIDALGMEMVEYHIDTLDDFQIRMNETKFGEDISVQKNENENPIIISGHD